jgi:hypothetical protein
MIDASRKNHCHGQQRPEDYLWFGDADGWYFTAADIKKLSAMPYDPMWCVRKLV